MSGIQLLIVGGAGASVPGAPTIGTAAVASATSATVSFTQPANNGGSAITLYTATSSPGGITGTLSQATSGTITVSGLTVSTAYTFTVTATNAVGTSAASSASNSITPFAPGQVVLSQATFGSNAYWTAPANVTSISIFMVQGGATGGNGGSTVYKNNISVTPGATYYMLLYGVSNGASAEWGVNASYTQGTGSVKTGVGTSGRVGDGGGYGGGSVWGGGGAGGYIGNGGTGGLTPCFGCTGTAGAGGGGGGGGERYYCSGGTKWAFGAGGGGVGLLGQGANGAAGYYTYSNTGIGGGGGSGGGNGQNSTVTGNGTGTGGSGGAYGGGGQAFGGASCAGNAQTVIRIIWPGSTRQFPSTGTADQ